MRAAVVGPDLYPDEIVGSTTKVSWTRSTSLWRRNLTKSVGRFSERIEGIPRPGRRLLQIGANVGLSLDLATYDRGWEASGIEGSFSAVEQGRERLGVDLRQGAVETLDVEPASVDALVMLDVLEHLADPAGALRHLRPADRRFGCVGIGHRERRKPPRSAPRSCWPWFIRSHLHYFRPATLTTMLADAGFETVELSEVPR